MRGREKRERANREPASSEDARFYTALGRAIKVLRVERGLGRKDLAERAEVSYPYLSEIENGRKRASSRALLAIAQALGVRPHQVLQTAETLMIDIEGEDVSGPATSPGSRPYTRLTGDFEALQLDSQVGDLFDQAAPATTPASPRTSWFRPRAGREAGDVREGREDARSALITDLLHLARELSVEDLERLLDLARRLRTT